LQISAIEELKMDPVPYLFFVFFPPRRDAFVITLLFLASRQTGISASLQPACWGFTLQRFLLSSSSNSGTNQSLENSNPLKPIAFKAFFA
jgi:hypothetical protein